MKYQTIFIILISFLLFSLSCTSDDLGVTEETIDTFYKVKLEPVKTVNDKNHSVTVPGLHSFAFGTYYDKDTSYILAVGGRTNGLHPGVAAYRFSNDEANKSLHVIKYWDNHKGALQTQTWSRKVNDRIAVDDLAALWVNNPQFSQVTIDSTELLYVFGGIVEKPWAETREQIAKYLKLDSLSYKELEKDSLYKKFTKDKAIIVSQDHASGTNDTTVLVSKPYVTAIRIKDVVQKIIQDEPIEYPEMVQTQNHDLARTGGNAGIMGSKNSINTNEFYLALGWEFPYYDNSYNRNISKVSIGNDNKVQVSTLKDGPPRYNQANNDSIAKLIFKHKAPGEGYDLTIIENPGNDTVYYQNLNVEADTFRINKMLLGDYRRRDGLMGPIVRKDDKGDLVYEQMYYGGVFKYGFMAHGNPIHIKHNDSIEIYTNFSQNGNNYTCPLIPTYDEATNTMYTSLLGGMTGDSEQIPPNYFQLGTEMAIDSFMLGPNFSAIILNFAQKDLLTIIYLSPFPPKVPAKSKVKVKPLPKDWVIPNGTTINSITDTLADGKYTNIKTILNGVGKITFAEDHKSYSVVAPIGSVEMTTEFHYSDKSVNGKKRRIITNAAKRYYEKEDTIKNIPITTTAAIGPFAFYNLPFTQDVSTIAMQPNGTGMNFTQTTQKKAFPNPPGSDHPYFGSNAVFIRKPNLSMYPNDVIKLTDLFGDNQKEAHIGYVYGGINAKYENVLFYFAPAEGSEFFSMASNQFFKVTLVKE